MTRLEHRRSHFNDLLIGALPAPMRSGERRRLAGVQSSKTLSRSQPADLRHVDMFHGMPDTSARSSFHLRNAIRGDHWVTWSCFREVDIEGSTDSIKDPRESGPPMLPSQPAISSFVSHETTKTKDPKTNDR